jgi:E3 ubiquitin-protein ligase UBR7
MDGTFDDEGEPSVTIGEYLEEVEERELVNYFLHC